MNVLGISKKGANSRNHLFRQFMRILTSPNLVKYGIKMGVAFQ